MTLGVVTKTWLSSGQSLDADIQDLADGAGLGMICRNRQPGNAGIAHRAVAVIYNKELCSTQEILRYS